ncbi:hypothetical protein [Scytonema millei]|uniref:Uncharacterized protein n=1 Tax=Scytonema millei VB511283 TaxID=1245923 RepID=A0A9X5I3I3_9CYAN|nr:hypothetical protein [Scytonema millei]NHC33990.1 hypothetical protein [Scytonema millei VB511283]
MIVIVREQGAGGRESRGAEGAGEEKTTINQLPTTNYQLPVTNFNPALPAPQLVTMA